MRTLCVGVVTVTMLAGSVVGVTGQDEPHGSPTASLEMQAIEGRHTATLLDDGTVLSLPAPVRVTHSRAP